MSPSKPLHAYDLTLVTSQLKLSSPGDHTYLSQSRTVLLATLMHSPDYFAPYERLIDQIWGNKQGEVTTVMKILIVNVVHIKARLRLIRSCATIENIRMCGYQLQKKKEA